MKIKIICIGKTILDFDTKENYQLFLKSIIQESQEITCYVLPEYAWGDIEFESIEEFVLEIQRLIGENQLFILGSAVKIDKSGTYNTAIAVQKQKVTFIEKNHVLKEEQEQHNVKPGINQEVVYLGPLKIAIIICADIWDHQMLETLVLEKEADVLLIPAFTVVPKGFARYARTQWYSLGLVRGRELLVPIGIADHHSSTNRYDVGGATCIVNPSLKHEDLVRLEDFLELPNNEKIVESIVDLDDVVKYRLYRTEKGIHQP